MFLWRGLCAPLFFALLATSLQASEIDIEWQRMLRYIKGPITGFQSSVYNSEFFITKDGRVDPLSELTESLKVLKSDAPIDDNNFICRFPLRAYYLNKKFDLKKSLDYTKCPMLHDFLKRVDPEAVSIVFASYGTDGPASLFGHTLFRLHKKGNSSELLDYGVNYAAEVDTNNAFMYGVKGLLGGFDGRFSLLPYFYKIREYQDVDSRDVWDYKLKLTSEEVLKLSLHLFELDRAHFTYYYLTKNCSYALLEALETVNPLWNLTRDSNYFVIPIDTVFTLKDHDLIESEMVNPSPILKLTSRISSLSKDNQGIFYKGVSTINGGSTPNLHVGVQILDLYIDYIDFKFSKILMAKSYKEHEAEAIQIKNQILLARSKIKEDSTKEEIKIDSPLGAHRARKLSLGFIDADRDATLVAYRFAFHDLTDYGFGSPKNMSLTMGRFEFQYLHSKEKIQIREATVAEVLNLKPISKLLKPLSWSMKIGAENDLTTHKDDFIPQITGGVGYTLGNDFAAISFIPVGSMQYDHRREKSDLNFKIGPQFLFHSQFFEHLKVSAYLKKIYNIENFNQNFDFFGGELNYIFAKNLSTRVQINRYPQTTESILRLDFMY